MATGSVAPLVEQLRRSSEFTVGLSIATRDVIQTGPARIVSISNGALSRNLTIAQWEDHLSLRVRSRVGRVNGRNPELVADHFFSGTAQQQLMFSFSPDSVGLRAGAPIRSHAARLGAPAGMVWLLAPPNGAMVRLGGWPLRLMSALPTLGAAMLLFAGFTFILVGKPYRAAP